MNAKPPRKITGRMVLIGFVAFFGVIAAVNGVFMYFALSTWPGLTTEDAYKKGVAYNRTLDEAAVQARLGWRSAVAIDVSGELVVSLAGKDGAPIQGARVDVTLSRPLGSEAALSLMLEEIAPGRYGGRFTAPDAGRWKADIKAQLNDNSYRMRHEVMVR